MQFGSRPVVAVVHGVIPRDVPRANAKSQPVLICHMCTWSRVIGSVVGWIDLPMVAPFVLSN
jgi:hypothetical protein